MFYQLWIATHCLKESTRGKSMQLFMFSSVLSQCLALPLVSLTVAQFPVLESCEKLHSVSHQKVFSCFPRRALSPGFLVAVNFVIRYDHEGHLTWRALLTPRCDVPCSMISLPHSCLVYFLYIATIICYFAHLFFLFACYFSSLIVLLY